MTLLARALIGEQIHSVHVDSEITYIMLTNGTQVTIKGLVIVAPNACLRAKPSASGYAGK